MSELFERDYKTVLKHANAAVGAGECGAAPIRTEEVVTVT